MRVVDSARSAFLTRVLTSAFPHAPAKRFAFADGEVGAVYTLGRDPRSQRPVPVVLFVASFPPVTHGATHHYGLVFSEQPVADAAEAAALLAQFTRPAAARYRASCVV